MENKKQKLFDAHFHIFSPKYTLRPNNKFTPEYFEVENYRKRMAAVRLVGGTLITSSFQMDDDSYIKPTLKQLGKNYVAVISPPSDLTATNIRRLNSIGVRAIRINLFRSNLLTPRKIKEIADKVNEIAGWHSEFYLDAKQLKQLKPLLINLPCCCIDHLGIEKEALADILQLAACGVYVKASGFGRTNHNIESALHAIWRANPHALLFGSDLPSTRAKRSFSDYDIQLIKDCFDQQAANKIFYENAYRLYKIKS